MSSSIKLSAQLPIGSDAWHVARCGEGKCPQDSTVNQSAKDRCVIPGCPIYESRRLRDSLETGLAKKQGLKIKNWP